MNKFFLLLLLLHGFVSSIEAQIVTIPDANFKNYLVNVLCVDTDGDGIPDDDVDTNNDGEVQVSEAEVVTFLKTSSGNISNLEGIQYFVNLQEFHCTFNHITNMDVTYSLDLRKLVCYRNELTAIHPGNYPNLEYLSVGENFLTSIDISDNSNLYYLAFPHNSISSINLLNNAPLEVLVGSYNNLTSLNVSNNVNLRNIFIEGNAITSLDFSANPNLDYVWCQENQLVNFNINNNNNEGIGSLFTLYNPNLSCIQVDDVAYAEFQAFLGEWNIDEWTEFSESCELGYENHYLSNAFNLYPNPVSQTLTVTSDNPILSTTVFNGVGMRLSSEPGSATQMTLDLAHLPAGIYFITIETTKGLKTQKVIKE